MKFTDGYWLLRPGVTELRPRAIAEGERTADRIVAHAPTRPVASRGDTLNCPQLTVTLDSPAEGIIGVTIEHWDQRVPEPRFRLAESSPEVSVASADGWSSLTSGTPAAKQE